MAKDSTRWCHFEQKYERYPKDVLGKAPHEKMVRIGKFSYLLAKKGEIKIKEEEARTPAEKSFFWPRMVGHPSIKKKHVWLELCNVEGEIEKRSIIKMENKE